MRFFRHALLVGMVILVALSGCRRRSTAPPAASAPEETQPPAAHPSATSKPAAAPASPATKSEAIVPDRLPTAPNDSSARFPIQQELTSAVHLYLNDYQKLPADLETLVKEKYLKTMPKPPPGKRFALDRNRLQVVIMD